MCIRDRFELLLEHQTRYGHRRVVDDGAGDGVVHLRQQVRGRLGTSERPEHSPSKLAAWIVEGGSPEKDGMVSGTDALGDLRHHPRIPIVPFRPCDRLAAPDRGKRTPPDRGEKNGDCDRDQPTMPLVNQGLATVVEHGSGRREHGKHVDEAEYVQVRRDQ